MMNNIRNTMCRLSDLTQEEYERLREEMPYGQFDFGDNEPYIGVTTSGHWGTWAGVHKPTIILYSNMMQLLKGKDMNKQTAQEQMTVMQIEMDKLKAIINTPEVKTGRVLNGEDLELKAEYWFVYAEVRRTIMDNDVFDKARIENGMAFHDRGTAEKYLEYLKLEQELRIAQAADGCVRLGGKRFTTILCDNDSLFNFNEVAHSLYAKISFKTEDARDRFFAVHTREQLILLIRGV